MPIHSKLKKVDSCELFTGELIHNFWLKTSRRLNEFLFDYIGPQRIGTIFGKQGSNRKCSTDLLSPSYKFLLSGWKNLQDLSSDIRTNGSSSLSITSLQWEEDGKRKPLGCKYNYITNSKRTIPMAYALGNLPSIFKNILQNKFVCNSSMFISGRRSKHILKEWINQNNAQKEIQKIH